MTAPSRSHRVRSLGAMAFLVLKESARSFQFNRGLEKAATLSYYGFFAMIPMLLIVVFLIGHWIASSDQVLQLIEQSGADWSPAFKDVILREVAALSRQRAWTLVGVLVLFWSVTPLTAAIRSAFSAIFKAERSSSFARAKLRDALAVLILLVSLVLIIAGQVMPSRLGVTLCQGWPPEMISALVIALRILIALLCAGLFYVAMAPVRISLSLLLTGSLLATLLQGLIGPVFGLILRFNPNYGYTFGSLKAVFLLFVWVYYSFAALLFTTEIMANIRRRDALVIKDLFLRPGARRRTPLLSRFLHSYAPGETLFREGDGGREMFYIVEGTVRLTLGGRRLRDMQEGEYFGEMAMLIDTPRTATAEAGEAGATLARISEDNFETVLRENPQIVLSILKTLATRLKATNEQLHHKAE